VHTIFGSRRQLVVTHGQELPLVLPRLFRKLGS
jgi:hypothetical protein